MLPQTQVGKTDIRISRLGLGTVKFGRNQSVKYPQTFELPSDADAKQLLHLARDLGINLLDTAPAYGYSEERLGNLLSGERKDWVICTKAGEAFRHDFDGTGNSQFNFEPEAIRSSVERSLRRLRTDYLDIVLIHSDGNDEHLIHHYQVLHTLSKLKKEGWIRAFGMSTKTLEGGIICAREADVVMTTFNPSEKDDERLMHSCAQHNAGVLLKKVFNSGHLLKPEYGTTTINAIIEQQMTGIFAQSAVNSAIIGTLNGQHLRSNVECALMGLAANSKLA
ncbi:MAG: aldo/keto reductase [Gammaproteobacteria bacterium]|nr:MAG: aldo/keto reductase [Gammaproteobacteria bacterium]